MSAKRPTVTGLASTDPSYFRPEPVSFVRRGDRMTNAQQRVWEQLRDTVLIDVPRHHASTSIHPDAKTDVPGSFPNPSQPLIVEIGTGLGEAMAQAAQQNPDTNFLAVEVYTPGLAKLMEQIEQNDLKNVRAIQANAPEVLDIALGPESVDELWIFFSDPWHKTRHHKRRLITDAFAQRAARVLKPGGLWRLATDWSHYAQQMRQVIDQRPEFVNVHAGERAGEASPLTHIRRVDAEKHEADPHFFDAEGGWAPRFEGRILTSFEAKAHQAGRQIFDLTARRL